MGERNIPSGLGKAITQYDRHKAYTAEETKSQVRSAYTSESFQQVRQSAESICKHCSTQVESHKIKIHERTCKAAKTAHTLLFRDYRSKHDKIYPSAKEEEPRGGKKTFYKPSEQLPATKKRIIGIAEVSDKPAFVRRPRTLVCYICGREYGTASL